MPGMSAWSQAARRQMTFLGQVNGAATSSIEGESPRSATCDDGAPDQGIGGRCDSGAVGSVVSSTDAPFGTKEAEVPESTDTVVSSSADTVSCFGSVVGPSFTRSSKAAVKEAVAVPSASGTRRGEHRPSRSLALRASRARKSAAPATEHDPTLAVAETSTSPRESSHVRRHVRRGLAPAFVTVADVEDVVSRLGVRRREHVAGRPRGRCRRAVRSPRTSRLAGAGAGRATQAEQRSQTRRARSMIPTSACSPCPRPSYTAPKRWSHARHVGSTGVGPKLDECAWQESNLRPCAPEAHALSPELQARRGLVYPP